MRRPLFIFVCILIILMVPLLLTKRLAWKWPFKFWREPSEIAVYDDKAALFTISDGNLPEKPIEKTATLASAGFKQHDARKILAAVGQGSTGMPEKAGTMFIFNGKAYVKPFPPVPRYWGLDLS